MTKRKILIVEDETISAMDIEDTLSRNGYDIAGIASNGTEAIRIAKELYPDLILMDIRIEGDMDGIEVANHINQYFEIPVIFLTAYSDDLTISRAVKAKSFSFLLKPFNERELLSNIEMAINKNLAYQKSLAVQRIMGSMHDLMSEYIITTDPLGNIIRINSATEQVTGIKREELSGKKIWTELPFQCEFPDILNSLIDQAVLKGEETVYWPYPATLRLKNGDLVQLDLSVNLLVLPNRQLSEIIYIFTPKKQNIQ